MDDYNEYGRRAVKIHWEYKSVALHWEVKEWHNNYVYKKEKKHVTEQTEVLQDWMGRIKSPLD